MIGDFALPAALAGTLPGLLAWLGARRLGLAGLLLGEPVAPAMVAVTGLVVLCVAGAKRFAKPPSSGLPTGAPVASPRR